MMSYQETLIYLLNMKNNLTKRNYTIIELLVSLMVMLGPTLLIIIYGYMREPVTDYDLIGFAMAGLLNVLFACTGLVLYLIFVRINIISILVGLILFCLALGSPFISLSIHDERVVKYENLRLQDITPIVEDLLLRDVRAEKVEVFFSTTEPFKFLEIKEDFFIDFVFFVFLLAIFSNLKLNENYQHQQYIQYLQEVLLLMQMLP